MSRGQNKRCNMGGYHQMGPFEIKRRDNRTKQLVISSGTRCTWCKKPEGKVRKEVKKKSSGLLNSR